VNRRRRGRPGFQRTELRLDPEQHEFVLPAEIAELSAQQPVPGQRLGTAGQDPVERLVKGVERRQGGAEIGFAPHHPFPNQGKRGEQAARGGVGRQLAQERLGLDDRVERCTELIGVEQQQAFARKIGRGIRPPDFDEMRLVGGQAGHQGGGGQVGLFRIARIDHRHHEVGDLRKIAVECELPGPPWQSFRKHQRGIGGDAQMPHGNEQADPREDQGRERHQNGIAVAERDERREQALNGHAKTQISVATQGFGQERRSEMLPAACNAT
jgi:hypothetical protein